MKSPINLNKHFFCVLILLFSNLDLFAQIYNMSNNSVTDNTGTLYDSGGAGGVYGANEDFTFTICPSNPPECFSLNFSQYDVEDSFDFLTIYDGPNTASPQIGQYSGTSPIEVQSTSGCFTLTFTSDGSVNQSGWEANWGPCPPPPEVNISFCPDELIAETEATICANACVELSTDFEELAQTTNYVVEDIPYVPYPYNAGNILSVPIDDRWSDPVSIDFNFCFYGNVYNQLVIGTNGLVSFELGYAGNICVWNLDSPWPNPTQSGGTMVTNVIGAPYQDIDPSVGGVIRYGTFGEAPCRIFIVNFENIPMFSCNDLVSSQQIVLYETSNYIETFIEDKLVCSSWNEGSAIHGIQNATGTQAVVVPGRNWPVQWTTNDDGKRFLPSGAPAYDITWFDSGTPVGSGPTASVCPAVTTTYDVVLNYNNCDGNSISLTDDVTITVAGGLMIDAIPTNANCGNADGSIEITVTGGLPFLDFDWSDNSLDGIEDPSGLAFGTYSLTVTDGGDCTAEIVVEVEENDGVVLNPISTDVTCNGGNDGTIILNESGGTTFTFNWNGPTSIGNTGSANGLSPGSYSVTVTNESMCSAVEMIEVEEPDALNCDDGNDCTEDTFDPIICDCVYITSDCNNSPTSEVTCDDGLDCTINDIQTILDCDGSICEPCMGEPTSCTDGPTSEVACDDGMDCTINDMQTILDCDGSICEPCMGEPADCNNAPTAEVACDDGMDCTINDMQTILDCDGSICEPCMGVMIDCSNGPTSVVSCDDGDDCTGNDMQTILD